MKCEKCKQNEATFFYEETVNGKTRSYHLCRDCAEKMKESGELQEAIKAENFERAAELRDEIKALDETKEAN